METKKRDIRALTKDQLRNFFVEQGDKPFRGNQVYEWLWQKSAHDFDAMTNISKETRQMLEDNFVINHIRVDQMQRSSDGTIKNAVRLHDGCVCSFRLIGARGRDAAQLPRSEALRRQAGPDVDEPRSARRHPRPLAQGRAQL